MNKNLQRQARARALQKAKITPFERIATPNLGVVQTHVMRGDVPYSAAVIDAAPMWTFFPGDPTAARTGSLRSARTGDLPWTSAEAEIAGGLHEEEASEPAFFIGSRDDLWYSPYTAEVIECLYLNLQKRDTFFPDFSIELEGQSTKLYWRDGDVLIGEDASYEWSWWAGYTLLKVPDNFGDPSNKCYIPVVVDILLEHGNALHFRRDQAFYKNLVGC